MWICRMLACGGVKVEVAQTLRSGFCVGPPINSLFHTHANMLLCWTLVRPPVLRCSCAGLLRSLPKRKPNLVSFMLSLIRPSEIPHPLTSPQHRLRTASSRSKQQTGEDGHKGGGK